MNRSKKIILFGCITLMASLLSQAILIAGEHREEERRTEQRRRHGQEHGERHEMEHRQQLVGVRNRRHKKRHQQMPKSPAILSQGAQAQMIYQSGTTTPVTDENLMAALSSTGLTLSPLQKGAILQAGQATLFIPRLGHQVVTQSGSTTPMAAADLATALHNAGFTLGATPAVKAAAANTIATSAATAVSPTTVAPTTSTPAVAVPQTPAPSATSGTVTPATVTPVATPATVTPVAPAPAASPAPDTSPAQGTSPALGTSPAPAPAISPGPTPASVS